MINVDNISYLRAALLNFKRLRGISLSNKINYVIKTIAGEIIRNRTIGTFGLRLVEISLTDMCQCRCKHCFAAHETDTDLTKNELSTKEVVSLLDEISEIGGVEVCFSGGEPLLRKDVIDLVEYAHKKGLVSRLITNGIYLDQKMVEDLKNAGLNWCSLSLDSAYPDIHDEFRGYKGSFNKVISGLKLLLQYKIPCSIITVARKELIHSGELEDIVNLGKELGVTVVRINFPVPIGRFQNDQEQVLTFEEREKVRKLLKHGIVSMESPRESTTCTAAVTKLNVLANGDVTPCVFVPLSHGNIRERKFIKIWDDMGAFIKDFKAKGQCPMCNPSLREKLFQVTKNQ